MRPSVASSALLVTETAVPTCIYHVCIHTFDILNLQKYVQKRRMATARSLGEVRRRGLYCICPGPTRYRRRRHGVDITPHSRIYSWRQRGCRKKAIDCLYVKKCASANRAPDQCGQNPACARPHQISAGVWSRLAREPLHASKRRNHVRRIYKKEEQKRSYIEDLIEIDCGWFRTSGDGLTDWLMAAGEPHRSI